MYRLFLFFLLILISIFSNAQSVHVGMFGGISNYQGDLADKIFVPRAVKAAGGITGGYELSRHWTLRGGFLFTKLTSNDKYNSKPSLQARNLSFTTSISESSLVGEYATFNLDEKKWTPYLFGGVALYHFDPYTFDEAGKKVYLKPLSTEGQGISGYTAKPYARTQLALPFGAGFRYALNDNIRAGVELGIRKLFTDYLDDVSTNYAAAADLLQERGALSLAYAYRGDEMPGGNPAYPEKGAQRGGSIQKDYYYTTGFTLSFRLGNRTSYAPGRSTGKRSGYGCPASPL